MIGVDTNILVRFFVGDDPAQADKARELLAQRNETDPAFVSVLVVAELVWVLQKFYEVPQAYINEMLGVLMGGAGVIVERQDLVAAAAELAAAEQADLADLLISTIARDEGCSRTFTFDKRAARRVPGMELLA